MAKYLLEQISSIVMKNPNKGLIDAGKKQASKLMMHLHGVGMEEALAQYDYFENVMVYKARKQYTISNKDLFGRLLQMEDMIFTANGGSSYFSLSEDEETKMNALLDDVRYELPLRKWMRNFALQAYRSDPMGIIFMEIEQMDLDDDNLPISTPKCYPTYKSIYSIYDYLPDGRQLEYVCFQLSVGDAIGFGISDPDFKDRNPTDKSEYFRFVDDEKDILVKRVNNGVVIATNAPINPIANPWERTPGFILSDLIQYDNPQLFVSPLDLVVELADCFLNDRSVRDTIKKFHGFPKAIEPLLQCGTCGGGGMLSGSTCPDCTPPGANKGTGYKLRTKPSDVSKFPLESLKEGFDFKKIFGYVTPDIAGWDKQDASLTDLEDMMEMTYWGTARMIKHQQGQKQNGQPKTATEVNTNIQPRYARLNMTADWAENTESLIADFIGQFWFESSYKASNITYGRNYVLETPDELMAKYQDMRAKGAPEAALDDVLLKYYNALYQNNPVQLTICTKLMMLEPFVHLTLAQCLSTVEVEMDYIKKVYFGDWKRKAVTTDQLFKMKVSDLDLLLEEYVKDKKVQAMADSATKQAQLQAATQNQANIRTGDRNQKTVA